MKTLRTLALATVFGAAALAAGQAQAGMERIESNVWEPGMISGEGRYYKFVETDKPVLGELDSVRVLISQVPRPGYEATDHGVYEKVEANTDLSAFATALGDEREPGVQLHHTWEPGRIAGDNGLYHTGR